MLLTMFCVFAASSGKSAYPNLVLGLTQQDCFATMRVGARNTLRSAVAIPTASGNFSCLIVFYGWGAPNRKAGGMTDLMFRTPRPPYACRSVEGGYQSRSGDDTMSKLVPMSVDFHGTTLSLINKDEKAFVALKPICEALSIQWEAQLKRIRRNPVLSQGVSIMDIPSNGGSQEMICLPLSMLNGWLFGINANRVKNSEIRQKLIEYQFECYDALNNYWNGKAEPKKETDVQSLLKKINEFARVLITFDVSSGKQHVAALPEHIKMVDTHSESQILQLINCLDRVHFPMILDQVIQYFKECEKDYHRVQRDLYQLRNAQKREVVCTSQSK